MKSPSNNALDDLLQASKKRVQELSKALQDTYYWAYTSGKFSELDAIMESACVQIPQEIVTRSKMVRVWEEGCERFPAELQASSEGPASEVQWMLHYASCMPNAGEASNSMVRVWLWYLAASASRLLPEGFDVLALALEEYRRATEKHPGMTLECDGLTDAARLFALVEKIGEVAACLTYDNDAETGHGSDLESEVIQVIALALAWATRYLEENEHLDRQDSNPRHQAYASNGDEIEDAHALRDSDGDYRTPERRLLRDKSGPIAAWEEVTAVPTSALKRLQDAFRGAAGGSSGLHGDKLAAILEITSYLPVDKPGPLDQAVADAKNTSAQGILEDFTLNDRISLLLDAVRDTHTGEDLRYRLARVVRLAYTWADLEGPSRDAVEDIRNRAAAEAGRCGGDLATLARLVGELAARASEGRSPRPALLALGSRALAWAAKVIEDGE